MTDWRPYVSIFADESRSDPMETDTVVVAKSETQPATGPTRARLVVLLLCVGLSAGAAVPFFFMGRQSNQSSRTQLRMPVTHDMHLHFEQMKSFYNNLSSGTVYPRWEEDTNRHFGAPTTSYYPPGIYYITSLLFVFLRDWWSTLLGTYLIVMVASAAAIYLYARERMSRLAASVTMGAYIFLPYHILDQYQRGAMAEMLGFVWAPLMLLFGERLFRDSTPDGKRVTPETGRGSSIRSSRIVNIAALAAVYGAFLWSHPPTAYQFTLCFGLCVLILAMRRRDPKGLVSVGVAIGLGVALSGAYLVSAAVEENLIGHEYVSENWPYHTTYVFVHNLPYRAPHMGFFTLIDATWIASTVGIVVLAVALLGFNRRRRLISQGLKERVLLWLVMGCFVAFMMTKASYYAGGRYIPKIDIGVFTWRMLSISTLVVALLIGACVQAAATARTERRKWALSSLTAAVLITMGGGIALSIILVVRPMYYAPFMEASVEHINLALIPRTAYGDPFTLPHLAEADLAEGRGTVEVERWDPEHRTFRVALPEADQLSIRTYNVPGWTATVDDTDTEIVTGARRGEITLLLPAGVHKIKLDYENTPARRAGSILSMLAAVLLLILFTAATVVRRFGLRTRDA
jgi:hypothetical protein